MVEEKATTSYKVNTSSFEGPLELLLSLIEQRKLFVNDVSLSQVTDDYISHIKKFENEDKDKKIANLSYFVLIAATLILIKSKSLLPNLSLTEDEEEKIVDLEQRLRLYQIIKEASIDIKSNFGVKIIFQPRERTWDDTLFSPDKNINIDVVLESINNVINNAPKEPEKLQELEVKKVINIEEMINNLTERIHNSLKISFSEFSKTHDSENDKEVKINIIVSFLAMLELVREGVIDVIQHSSFSDIEMHKHQKILN